MFHKYRNQTGFTLMEMMVVVAIIAIGAAISIPAFTAMLPGMRLNGARPHGRRRPHGRKDEGG